MSRHTSHLQEAISAHGRAASWPSALASLQSLLSALNGLLSRVEALPAASAGCRCQDIDEAIGLPEVLRLVGLKKSTWYQRLNPKSPYYDPLAPQPIKDGRSSTWSRREVAAYRTSRADARPNMEVLA